MDHTAGSAPVAPAVERWNQQAWPPVTFGVPSGWTDLTPQEFEWLAVERRLPPDAPVLAGSAIVAGVRHDGAGGHPWQVQLRRYSTPALATFVLDDPQRWSGGRRLIGDLDRDPEHRAVGGQRAVVLTYRCQLDEATVVFCEAWLDGPGAYYFVGGAPAQDALAWRAAFDTMIANVAQAPVQAAPPTPAPVTAAFVPRTPLTPLVPVVRYRCPVQSQLPVTLENVSTARPRVLVFGSSSTVAWAALGVAAASLYGRAKANSMEGRTVSVPATGEAVLTDDRIALLLVAGDRAAGVSLRADLAARTVDLEIPFGLIRRFGTESAGVYLDLVGRGAVWIRSHDDRELAGWIAHLSHGKTWQPPRRIELSVASPVVGWCQQDPRYTFGLPPGWVAAPTGALADFATLFVPSVLRCGVLRDAGQHEAQVFVVEVGPAQGVVDRVDEESLGAMLAEGMPSNHGLESTAVDGELLVLLRGLAADDGGVADRCLGAVVHHGVLYALWFGTVGGQAGDGSYETWLAQFRTMLATWHWYG